MAPLSQDDRKTLLRIARESIAAELRGTPYEAEDPESAALAAPGGVFVTLHCRRALRGCIGTFEASGPLVRTVAEMARSAAFEDPRFRPLRGEELAELELDVSVLTPVHPIEASDVTVGVHGLYIVQGYHRGVLLPQVATEQGWDRETFLEETCRKAGLPRDAWKRGAKLYAFEAEVFGEE